MIGDNEGVALAAPPHRDLAAWQRADDLAHLVYRLTWKFMQADPGLVQRMRAAAVAVAAGITAARRGGRWQARRTLLGASIALGELSYYIHFARRAGFLGDADVRRLTSIELEVTRQIEPLLTPPRAVESAAAPP